MAEAVAAGVSCACSAWNSKHGIQNESEQGRPAEHAPPPTKQVEPKPPCTYACAPTYQAQSLGDLGLEQGAPAWQCGGGGGGGGELNRSWPCLEHQVSGRGQRRADEAVGADRQGVERAGTLQGR